MKALLPVIALLTVAAASAGAQSQAGAPASSVDLANVRTAMKNVLIAQETYFSDQGRYSPDLAPLKLTMSDSVAVRISEFSPNAYALTGTLKGAEGMSCVMMIGRVAKAPTTAQGRIADKEGAIICDGDKP